MADLPLTEKALYFISYDEYKDKNMKEFLPDDVCTLDKYLDLHPMIFMIPSWKVGTPEFPSFLPGESPNHPVYFLASEQAKRLSYSMLWVVWDTYQKGYCLGHFDQSNIFVCSSGRAKFRKLSLMVRNDVLLRNSLLNVRKILDKVFTNDRLPIPDDIKHLLDLLLTETLACHGLFHIHASLLPRCTRFAAQLKMHEKMKYGLSLTEKETVYTHLPYIHVWKTKISMNVLLQKSFNHFKANYKDPNDWQTLDPHELSKIRGEKFSDYMRNSTAHRMEPDVQQTQMQAAQLPVQPLVSKQPHALQGHRNQIAAHPQQGQKNQSCINQASGMQSMPVHLHQGHKKQITAHHQQGQNNHPWINQSSGMQSMPPHLHQGHGNQITAHHQQGQNNQAWINQASGMQPVPLHLHQGRSSQFQTQKKWKVKQKHYTANDFDMVYQVHYPMYLVQMQEEIFKLNPEYIKELEMEKLFN